MSKYIFKKNKDGKKYSNALERYKKKRRQEILFLSSILIFIIFIFIFLNSSYVKIKNININGAYQLKNEEIIAVINDNYDKKYWNVNEDNIKNTILNEFNIVENINVRKEIFNNIYIDIKEKRILAIEEDSEDNKYILQDGTVFNGKITKDLSVPFLENFDENINRTNLIKNLLELDELVLSRISEIVYSNNEEAIIYMKDGQKIKININNFSNKLNYYFEIEKYIDDKKNTVLNLINGAFLENKKTISNKEKNINNILLKNKKEDNKNLKENLNNKNQDKNNEKNNNN